MVDFLTPLISAGFSLAEKIVFSWFEQGKSDIRLSRVEEAVAQLAQPEAERLRLREDDLQRVTDDILRRLIASSPHMSYVKPRFHETVIRLDYDPAN